MQHGINKSLIFVLVLCVSSSHRPFLSLTFLGKEEGQNTQYNTVLFENIYGVEMSLKSCCQTRGHILTRSTGRRAPIMSGWHRGTKKKRRRRRGYVWWFVYGYGL